MSFLLEYIKHPLRIGAIAPSGKSLSAAMMKPVDFARAETIVEYGPGTGSFTQQILARKRPQTKLILIEQNETFFQQMHAAYHGLDNTIVLYGSAEEAHQLVAANGATQADAVISGLPFASLPADVSLRIVKATQQLLGDDGAFITFQYTKVKDAFFREHFRVARIVRVWRNLPPAYIYVLKGKGARQ